MASDCGRKPSELRVDGGASANQFLMQFQADVLGCKVIRPAVIETTALGAALLAGLAVGVWKDMDEIRRVWQMDLSLTPQMTEQEREKDHDALAPRREAQYALGGGGRIAREPEFGALRGLAEVKAGSARLFAGIFTRLIGFASLCRIMLYVVSARETTGERIKEGGRRFSAFSGCERGRIPRPKRFIMPTLTELDECTHQSTKKCMKDAGMSKKTAKKE